MQAKQSRSFGHAAISFPESLDETTHFAPEVARLLSLSPRGGGDLVEVILRKGPHGSQGISSQVWKDQEPPSRLKMPCSLRN